MVHNLLVQSSDYSALLLDLEGQPRGTVRNRFRFESCWLYEEVCRPLVENAWMRSVGSDFQQRILECDLAAVNEYLSTQHELTVLSSQEELYWQQRAKQLWLKEGDSNMNYFHKSAYARKRSNYLKRIKNADDDWVEGPSMKAVILEYYYDIFKTASTSVNFLHHVQKCVTDDMNS
ncbi:PREDICTED: uncharacterized protein LOC109147115 [Ipomoea nil]|uniref:uncharacterized protein LOC109147115 n=1 Tax=Ipomoea nil TaxID=35883 RepID=UPI000901A603|nr:PREDICTED: uncharacterized protein LOC109147115 [Ipomoea nil]